MSFISSEFMLKNKTAQQLYHEFAETLPIIDYHCHISPAMMAADTNIARDFDKITQLCRQAGEIAQKTKHKIAAKKVA